MVTKGGLIMAELVLYVYLGLILGVMGGMVCWVISSGDNYIGTVYLLSGGIIGIFLSITMTSLELNKFWLGLIITAGYVGASIFGRLLKG